MEVNIIVAAGEDGAIGRNGDLIWRISSDLKRFKALTMGNPVIMGRKTWDSLPKKPLPGRHNIVVSRNPDFVADGATVVQSPEDALAAADGEPFIMGGEQIYKVFMPYATRIYLTAISGVCPDADARLDFPFDEDWKAVEESEPESTPDGVVYRYVTYCREK